MKILIADDKEENRHLLEVMLKRSGYEVVLAHNGIEALDILRKDGMDMIIADILMPEMDGYTLCRECKKDNRIKKIPFLFYTATYGDEEDEKFAMSLGAESFIRMPAEPDKFLKVIKGIIKKYQKGSPAVQEIHPQEEDIYRADYNKRIVRKLEQKVTELAKEITERKKLEGALKASEERYRALYHENPSMFFTLDTEGNVISVNEFGAAQLGYTVDELQGQSVLKVFYEQDRADVTKQLKACMENPWKVYHWRFRKVRKDGSLLWVEEFARAVIDQKQVLSVLVVCQDVTERKTLETQLVRAQKMEAVGQLAGGIAHDFNNILTAMIGYGHLLKMKMGKDDPLRNYADQILSLAQKAAALTHGLLAFSRERIMNPKPVALNEVIRSVEKLLRRIIGEDIELKIVLGEENLIVMADSVQLEQVLMNLATNARDAMPDGGLLNIETRVVEIDENFIKRHGYGSKGKYALMSVTDTGIGMDERTRERIFEPFFTTKEVGKGTGLGLSMVYGIIKQHEGYINVYSELGKGTAFNVYLPLVNRKVEEATPDVMPSPARGTETLLLAEDDAEVRGLTKNLLEDSGYKVIEAVDGEDAVKRFKENKDKVQLLLVDVIMPKKNGREAYIEIHKMRPDIKALFISGYTADVIRTKGVIEEGFEFILKPVSPMVLLAKVREVLDK
jgi:two-component system cell cycle sensor histidine kinase/response regulator CckA